MFSSNFLSIDIPHQYALRRIRNNNSGLVVGRFYKPDELRQKGFQLEEITLEGVVRTPEDENFLIYEVKKNGQVAGWLWKEVFLDRARLDQQYKLFIDAHARMDNILLTETKLDAAVQQKLELVRHRIHLWALLFARVKLFGSASIISYKLAELKAKVMIDILNKGMELGEHTNFIVDGKDFGLINVKNKMAELTYRFQHLKDYIYGASPPADFYSNVDVLYIYKAIKEFWEKQGYALILFTQKESQTERHFHADSEAYYEYYIQTNTLRFNAELIPLFSAQFSYLNQRIRNFVSEQDQSWDKEVLDKLVESLKEVDWHSYLLSGRSFEFYSEMGKIGSKGLHLRELRDKVKVPVPNFRIVKKEESLPAKGDLFKEGEVLLYAVRSSPPLPMPGLVDTVLNVGLTEEGVKLLAQKYDERFAYETSARFLRSFGSSVLGIKKEEFGDIPSGLNAQTAKGLAERYKRIIEDKGFKIPPDPYEQVQLAVKVVKDSWNSPQAKQFRKDNDIPDELGTAIILQEMKFGNLNEKSGAFILSTRHDVSGEKQILIEYLPQRQAEDLVGGRINPMPIENSGLSPLLINGIKLFASWIEKEFKEMEVIEGLIEDGRVWFLDAKDAVVSPEASARIAVEMVNEGLLTKEELFMRIDLKQLKEDLDHFEIATPIRVEPVAKGEGVYTGAVSGAVALNPDKLRELEDQGIPAIWLKNEAVPGDYTDMGYAEGLVVRQGGRLSHGALLGRSLKKPTIVGVTNLRIDERRKTVTIGGKTFKEGDFITIDGKSGNIYTGRLNLIKPLELNPYFKILAQWYKEIYGKEV
ncbi:MAG: PEP-utilizing enzyme [Candidatus Omnitrophica bacterium]|nr:PEP-utilizing enzyme [Candidatus Omnitrophota bacterium]